jgi:hypothetical protein
LAFVNQIGIVDDGIGLGDAQPEGGVAKMGPGDLGEGVALLNDDACGRAKSSGNRGQENMRACHDVVRVNNGRIGCDQIVPAKTVAEILLRKLPQGVAGLYCQHV